VNDRNNIGENVRVRTGGYAGHILLVMSHPVTVPERLRFFSGPHIFPFPFATLLRQKASPSLLSAYPLLHADTVLFQRSAKC
jgi:hypothetical protein